MALLVLAEEELVAVDLTTEGWPSFHLPYLAALHSSSVTCAHYVGDIPDEIWQKILSAGQAQGLVANLSEKACFQFLMDLLNLLSNCLQAACGKNNLKKNHVSCLI